MRAYWPIVTPLDVITGPTRSVGSGATAVLPTDRNIRITGGPATLTLPTVASGVVDGQRLYIVSFDVGGNTIAIVPSATPGDNIVGGTQWTLANYASFVELQCRVTGSGATAVANWLCIATNTSDKFLFPIQPTLAAGAQGPISLGNIYIPQGVRSIHSVFACCDAVLTGGSLTVSLTGLVASPTTVTVASGLQGGGTLYQPGNVNRFTTNNGGAGVGTFLNATVSTIAGFGGATTVAFYVETW